MIRLLKMDKISSLHNFLGLSMIFLITLNIVTYRTSENKPIHKLWCSPSSVGMSTPGTSGDILIL